MPDDWDGKKTGPYMSKRRQTSKTAVVLTALYLLIVAVALTLLLLAGKNDALAGIYFILATFPWSSPLMWISDTFQIDSVLFNTLFLLAGGLLNGFIIYKFVSFLSGKFSDSR